jgi:hypothetical protein
LYENSTAGTAANIIAHEFSFRVGIVSFLFSGLIMFVISWALYILLRPVNRELALLALLFSMAECVIYCVLTIQQMITVRYLSNAAYLKVFEQDQLYAFANFSLGTYGSGEYVGFICLGLGTIVFAYLFLKSGYVPKAFAWLGILASVLLVLGPFSVILYPGMRTVFLPFGLVPLFLYWLGLGFWLLMKGVKLD